MASKIGRLILESLFWILIGYLSLRTIFLNLINPDITYIIIAGSVLLVVLGSFFWKVNKSTKDQKK